jgi:hypothetical protein
MGWNDRPNSDLHEDLEQAVHEGLIEKDSPGYGITQQVIRRGLDSLSLNQRHVYITKVVPVLSKLAQRQFVLERRYSVAE